jgi:peptidoglycan/LPS O-acetylase OafA/YrhL
MPQTFGSVLEKYKGIGPGFDLLRIVLASLVVLNHSFLIVDGTYATIERYHLWSLFSFVLPMFFALSGFLITGSAQRLKLKDFLLNRGLRIVPALAVDILIAALILGPALTTYPLSQYYLAPAFTHYFLNIVGFIHYELPGVFTHNPFPNQVNGSLWTVPYEIGCYLLMAVMIRLALVRSLNGIMASFVSFCFVFYGLNWYYSGNTSPLDGDTAIQHYLGNFFSDRGNYLYFYFFSGILVYVFRYHLPYRGSLALLSAGAILCSSFVTLPAVKPLLLTLPVGYLTTYLGLLRFPKVPLYSRGDYSYGIYLYAYPIQQMLVLVFPSGFSVTGHFLCSFSDRNRSSNGIMALD